MLRLAVFVAVLMVLVVPTFAQDTTIVVPNGAPPVETIAESLIRLIYNATFLPFAAGMVTVATAFTKRIGFLKRTSSSILSLWWTVLLWAIWIIATQAGFGGQFENLITGLTTIGAAMLGITLTPMAAGKIYQSAKSQNVAIIGHSRKRTLSRITDEIYGHPDNSAEKIPDNIDIAELKSIVLATIKTLGASQEVVAANE
ncbi:MAG: hypothetical protein Q9P01_05705 [Anaerolineae bacterium]|nr:hypothetical protein [Anaerolineae bacterium]